MEQALIRSGEHRVTVLGAGVMGPGIALTFLLKGFDVSLCDVSEKALQDGAVSVERSLRLRVEENMLTVNEAAAARSRLQTRLGVDAGVADADLVVEAVPEKKEIKRAVYASVQNHGKPNAVIWSNTSTLDVYQLVEPAMLSRIVIAHWFAPPDIVPLVEVVRAPGRENEALTDATVALLKSLGKTTVTLNKLVNGFVINRLQRLLGREIFYLLEEGVISAEDLDLAVRTSLAPRMQLLGLVQRYDFTGLDLSVRNLRDKEFVEAPFQESPPSLMEKVDAGHLGVSTGRGFYDYQGRDRLSLQEERDRHLLRICARLGDYVSDPKPI
jgi:3-hydroxybutyryl-CoA dehydrogenase